MAIDFSKYLSVEQQKAILTQNLQSWASEYYANSLNAKIADEAGNTAMAESALANMTSLEIAGALAQAELDSLSEPVVE